MYTVGGEQTPRLNFMKIHGTNPNQQALCGQANGKLELSPSKVTCKKCRRVMGKFLAKLLVGGK